jgi:hypothetical protein
MRDSGVNAAPKFARNFPSHGVKATRVAHDMRMPFLGCERVRNGVSAKPNQLLLAHLAFLRNESQG